MTAAREGKCDAVKFLLDSLQTITDEGVLTKFQTALPQGDRLPGYQEHMGGNLDFVYTVVVHSHVHTVYVNLTLYAHSYLQV